MSKFVRDVDKCSTRNGNGSRTTLKTVKLEIRMIKKEKKEGKSTNVTLKMRVEVERKLFPEKAPTILNERNSFV